MRAVILILILLVVGAIALIATGFVSPTLTREAEAPKVSVGGNGVVVQGGQTPKIELETGKIEVGTGRATIPVPEIRVAPGGNGNASQQPQPQTQPVQNGQQPATTDSTQQ